MSDHNDPTLFLYLEEIFDVNYMQDMKHYGEIFMTYNIPDFTIIYQTIHGALQYYHHEPQISDNSTSAKHDPQKSSVLLLLLL